MTVFCDACQFCEKPSASSPWYQYRCLKAPKDVPRQWVVEDPWLTESPHRRCRDVKKTEDCELFEPQPKETDNGT